MQNVLMYKIPATKMSDFNSLPSTPVNAKTLSMSKCIDLVKGGVFERFLRRYAVDYVPIASGYLGPVRLAEQDLLELMRRSSKVMATYDADGDQEISGISFAASLLLKTKLQNGDVHVEVQYFGSSLDDLAQHARAHLKHSVAVARGLNVNIIFHFPTCIDREDASVMFSKDVTHGLRNKDVNPTAYLSSSKLNRAKLLSASAAKPKL